jgi:hypothetical protein
MVTKLKNPSLAFPALLNKEGNTRDRFFSLNRVEELNWNKNMLCSHRYIARKVSYAPLYDVIGTEVDFG